MSVNKFNKFRIIVCAYIVEYAKLSYKHEMPLFAQKRKKEKRKKVLTYNLVYYNLFI